VGRDLLYPAVTVTVTEALVLRALLEWTQRNRVTQKHLEMKSGEINADDRLHWRKMEMTA